MRRVSETRDLYEVIGVARDASSDTMRKAYRKLARQLHPDVNPGDAEAETRFKEVAAAYDVLSDETKRKNYDEFGAEALRSGFDPDQARTYRQWQQGQRRTGSPFGGASGFGGPGGGGGGFGDMGDIGDLGDLFRQMRQQQASRPRTGSDIHASLSLDLKTAIRGTEVSVSVPDGSRGSRNVQVRIPKGAQDGDTLRIRGKGGPGANGGAAGDLVIEVTVSEHPVFRREGRDLHIDLPITLHEAYGGAKVGVPTFDGEVKMSVPAGSQSGQILRLRGKGIQRGSKTGDLYVKLQVTLPPAGDATLAKALEEAELLYPTHVREEARSGAAQ